MPLLPPAGYMSSAMAAVYSIVYVIYKETNLEYKKDPAFYLHYSGGPKAIIIKDNAAVFHAELTCEQVGSVRSEEDSENPFMVGGFWLKLCLEKIDKYPSPLTPDVEEEDLDINNISIVLKPPYKGCTRPIKYNSTTQIQNGAGTNDYSVTASVSLPDIETAVVTYFRQALAEARVKSFLLEETGEFVPLPGSFWRTEKAEGALRAESPLAVQIDGRTAIGYVFVCSDDVRSAWSTGYDRYIAKVDENKLNNSRPSPYISFMLKANEHFGLLDGQQPDGSRLMKDEIERWLAANWPPALGEKTPTLIKNMATLIRHPNAARGGNVRAPSDRAETGHPKIQRSRGIKQITSGA